MGTIGARLREERERVETSQAVFAAKLGQSRKSQIRYEAGDRTPDGDYLAAASAIGVDILYVQTRAWIWPNHDLPFYRSLSAFPQPYA